MCNDGRGVEGEAILTTFELREDAEFLEDCKYTHQIATITVITDDSAPLPTWLEC